MGWGEPSTPAGISRKDHDAEVLALRTQLDEAVRLLDEARVCEGLQEWDWPLCQRIDAWAAALNKEGPTNDR